jgi:hypothetical protein
MGFVVNVATDPIVLGSVPFTTGAMGLDVVGTTAYVMLEDSRLAIVDVTQPSQPVITVLFVVGGHSVGRGVSVTSQQYAAIGAGSFKIVDVRAPRSPVVLGGVGFNADCGRLTVRGEVAFVACGKYSFTTGGLLGIVTLANPADKEMNRGIGNIEYSTTVKDVELSADGTTAFLLGSSGAVAAYDVTNPARPSATPKSSVDSAGATTSYAIDREGTLLAVAAGRLELIDASNVSGLRRLGSDRQRDVRDVDLVGTTAYAVGAFGTAGRFWIYDVSNPASPSVRTQLDLAAPATAVKVIGRHAFVTTRSSTGTGALLVIGF